MVTPSHRFEIHIRTPTHNKRDCVFREIGVPLFYESDKLEFPSADHVLMDNQILCYTPPAIVYTTDLERYQSSLHDVVQFFKAIDGCYNPAYKKVMKC
jgi:hypothetical protein